jgi:hypothetical protein
MAPKMNEQNRGSAQLARLLERLHQGPVDTLTARRELNILMPAARIKELKDLGHDISKHTLTLTDDQGRSHRRMALYYLSTKAPTEVDA